MSRSLARKNIQDSRQHRCDTTRFRRLIGEWLEPRWLLASDIQGLVWNDLNLNGLINGGEPGLPDALVELVATTDTVVGNSDDTILGATATDSAGNYNLAGAAAGQYYLRFRREPVAGVGHRFTTANVGSDDSVDSDVIAAEGRSAVFSHSENTPTVIDAGLIDEPTSLAFAFTIGGDITQSARAVVADGQGNIYVGVIGNGDVDLDPGPATATVSFVGGISSAVAKYNSAGQFIWSKGFGGSAESLAVDAQGNVYLTGNGGGGGAFAAKLDSAGNTLWRKQLQVGINALEISVDTAGSAYIAGFVNGQFPNYDPMVWKLDTNGNQQWLVQTVGATSVSGWTVGVYATEATTYVTGRFQGTADFDPSSAVVNLTSSGSDDIFLWRLDSQSGAYVNAVRIGGSASDIGSGVTVSSDGSILLTGHYSGTVDFNPSPAVTNLTGSGGLTAFVAKLHPDGNLIWARSTQQGSSFGDDISVTSSGDIWTSGGFSNSTDFDPAPISERLVANNGGTDIYIWGLDSSGNLINAYAAGSAKFDYAHAMAMTPSGDRVLVAGSLEGAADFDPGAGTLHLSTIETLIPGNPNPSRLDGFLWAIRTDDLANTLPVITSNGGGETASVSVPENTTAVADVNATDVDAGQTLTYSIVGGADSGKFSINSVSGVLTFINAPDFENPTDVGANNVYEVVVQASDGSSADTQALAVTVTDIAEGCIVSNTNDSGAGSLREAINCADSRPGADTITFGNVFSDTTADVIKLTSGELIVSSDLTVQGPGASLLKLSGNNASRVLRVAAGTTVTVTGLTIADGNGVGGGIGPHGGGIYNEGTLTLRNVMVSQNRTRGIGGSQDNGGGIQNINGTLMLIDSTVDNNFAYGTGGGINNKQGTVTLVSSTVSNNSCASGAGGIGNFSGGIFTIINSTISGNSSGLFGGGIANSSGTLVVTNATITGNSSYNDYGGLYEFSSTTTLRNSIVAGNYKGGSGRPVFPSDIGGTITVASNNLIGDAGTASNIVHDADGNLATGSNNIVGNNGIGTIALSTVIDLLGNNGGPTKTHELVAGGLAIDRGSNALAKDAQNQPLTTDQRGVGFARIVNSVVDIGAFEFTPAPIGPPNAVDDGYTIAEDKLLTVPAPGVLGNDIRSDTGTLTAVLDNGPQHGTLNLNLTSGSFSYSPITDFSGTDSFTYHVTDGIKSSGKAKVTITVTSVNDPPNGSNKAVSTLEKTSYEFVTNDFYPSDFRDVPANSLQAVRIASLPTSGSLVRNGVPVIVGQFIPALGIASGGLHYVPPVNGVGNALASFTFQVQDDGGTANGGVDLDPTPNTITINVLPVNDAPVAVDDRFNADEDMSHSIPAPGVLANDNDTDADDTKTVVAVNAPVATVVRWDESISGDFPDFFAAPPVLTLQPGANEVRGTTGQPATGSADFDRFVIHVPDGARLTSVTWAFRRTVGAVGSVSWDVYAGATLLTSDSIVLPANEVFDGLALPLGPGQYLFRESSITQATGVVPSLGEYTFRFQLSRESSVGVPLTLASGAKATVNADGSFVYDPNGQFESLGAGQTTNDSFTYTMADSEGSESSATVAITIRGANDAPTAVSDEATVGENVALDVQAPGVLANDLDVDIGETTTVVAVNGQIASVGAALTLTSGALLTVQADGSYRYDTNGKFEFLAAGQSTTDSFVYMMADSQGATSAATVTITIQGVDDAPVAGVDGAQVSEDGVLEKTAVDGVLANDTDADMGYTTTVVAVNGVAANVGAVLTLASGAKLLLRADGSYRYEPNGKFEALGAGQTATETFTYAVADGAGETSIGTVTITILGQNDAPVAGDDVFETQESAPRSILKSEYLANDSDVDSSVLTGAVVDQPGHGSVSLLLDGSFVYTPVSGFSGLDKFAYRVSDGVAQSNVATISLNVTAVNHQPAVVLGGDVLLNEGQFFAVNRSFSDPDSGESWTARVNYGDGSGDQPLVLSANKTFQLRHTYVDNGNYAVTVSVQDSSGLSGGATLQAIVSNVAPQSVVWSGPLLATRGQSLKFAGGFSDLGTADTQVASVDWGDRSSTAATVTKTGGAWQVNATHAYASGGIFHPSLTIKDDDGGTATVATTVLVVGARINGNTFELIGSPQRDNIKLSLQGNALLVNGSLGSTKIAQAFPLSGVQKIVAYLGEGNDALTIDAKVKFPLLVNAGGGNDVITAGGGMAVLIGGLGQDQLTGGGKSDLLIAGTTAYDNRPAALGAILAEWSSGRPLADRMANLRNGAGSVLSGLNVALKAQETVFDDTAIDKLLGGGDLDWYWSDLKKDKITGKAAAEAVN